MPVHPDPWPGESLSYYDALVAAPVVDTQLWRDIAMRSDVGRTMAAGDVWHVYYEADTAYSDRYLDDPAADVAVSWVVEVNGGTGTLAASEGVAPSFPDPSDTAPTSLGTFPVSGASTVVIASAILGAAEVVDSGPIYLVRLECTSGSLDVQQVKLRVWPSAGVGGSWSELKPSWDGSTTIATLQRNTVLIQGNGTGSTPEAAYAAARDDYATNLDAAVASQARGMTTTGGVASAEGVQGTSLFDLDTYDGSWQMFAELVVAVGADPHDAFPIDTDTLVEGTDWTRPPTEVPNDRTNLVQQVGDGSTGWVNAIATIEADSTAPGALPPGFLFHTSAGDYATDVDPDPLSVAYDLPIPFGVAVTEPTETVPLVTTGRDLFMALVHTMPDAFPGGLTIADLAPGGESDILTYPTLPPYRVWVPVAVTEAIRVLRHGTRNDGRRSTAPRRWGQESSYQSGRSGGYQ